MIGKSKQGDLYAGRNGNVYKKDGNSWQVNSGKGWNSFDKQSLQASKKGSLSDRNLQSKIDSSSSQYKAKNKAGNSWSSGSRKTSVNKLNNQYKRRQFGNRSTKTWNQRSARTSRIGGGSRVGKSGRGGGFRGRR